MAFDAYMLLELALNEHGPSDSQRKRLVTAANCRLLSKQDFAEMFQP